MTARPTRRRLARLSLLLCASALLGTARDAHAQTVDEILAKHYDARGGLEKLKAVQTMRMTGKMVMGMGMEAPLTIEMKRPDKMRVDFSVQGMVGSQAYDGTVGWQVMPFMGKTDAEPVGADELKQLQDQADMDGALVDWKAKGHLVELVGKEPVEGAEAYKLKLTLKNGDVRHIYLDAEHFLEIRTDSKTTRMGGEVEIETSSSDYKAVEGLTFPFSMQMGAKGSPQKQTIAIEKIELNVPVDDARFAMPPPKPAAGETAPADAPKEAPKDPPKEDKKG